MGIYNRDYMKGDDRRPVSAGGPGSSGSWPPVCKWLIIANVAVFLLQMVSPGYVVEDWLALDSRNVLHGQIWRLVTSAFCHSREGIYHILFNMLFLWWFGKTLEQMYGSREFLLFYLAGALCASVAFIGLDLVTGNLGSAIGASGAVMAVMMLYAAHFPRSKVYIWFVIPVEIRWIVAAYVIFDLYPVLLTLGGSGSGDNIAHSAHLGGLAFGFLYWKRGWNLGTHWDALRMKLSGPSADRRREKPRKGSKGSGRKIIAMPGASSAIPSHGESSAGIEGEVDRILQKIADQGASSLTTRERATLVEASERIRDREREQ
jgi:membrane associated rhomboid family serine protease